jgi:hypothetical protein
LLVAVLPAEYGIDVTGAGRALGLDRLYDAGTSVVSAPVVVQSTILSGGSASCVVSASIGDPTRPRRTKPTS